MTPTVLIIDDDTDLLKLLETYLAKFGLKTLTASHPKTGLKLLKQASPSIIILDIMLPDMDGFEVCREIRKVSQAPVIMLSARGEVSDKVVGLELGADDYLAKPFDPRELVARIQTVLRRLAQGGEPAQPQATLRSGTLKVDPGRREASLAGEALDLTTTEFDVLTLLMERAGQTVDRDTIIKRLRGEDCEAFNRSVDLAVSRLRHKLGDTGKDQRMIKTVWGTGYIFVGKVARHA